jgi:hypothetical protein
LYWLTTHDSLKGWASPTAGSLRHCLTSETRHVPNTLVADGAAAAAACEIAGGTKPQMTNGVWPKAEAADIFNHAHDTITQVPTNTKLHEAGLGNWYLGELSRLCCQQCRLSQVCSVTVVT